MQSILPLSRELSIGGVTVRNRVFLAPMSGVTDLPMRQLAWQHGAGLVVSEMVAGGELVKGRSESVRRMRPAASEPHMVQLAGRDPHSMAEAARIAEGEGADIIDINMGCPAKKVTGGYCGSALMRDPDLAIRITEGVVASVRVPVTVKMRLGWDENDLNAPQLARMAEAAGAAMITVHGRTRCQFYGGKADWKAIARVSCAVTIPVVANGDVRDASGAGAMMAASGADAVMIGRGHYGAPWLAGRIAGMAAVVPPPGRAMLAEYICAHYEDMLSHYGRERGLRHARKHLGWYVDRHAAGTAPDARAALLSATEPMRVTALVRDIFSRHQEDQPMVEAA